ncbi:hypothetical protein PR048_027128 [Dryococelus australis]|uniref:Uncharacterized protein n=1 Tax=Dryococelus australis TaxID=614101 RepID=A0ABQ9GEK4_9NEOP|nr:hypothetical protein PR048_027128 [Dryococelus australis]
MDYTSDCFTCEMLSARHSQLATLLAGKQQMMSVTQFCRRDLCGEDQLDCDEWKQEGVTEPAFHLGETTRALVWGAIECVGMAEQEREGRRVSSYTDEATFMSNGDINIHNAHYWSAVNPHWLRQVDNQHMWNLNNWCGYRVIGTCFLEGQLNDAPYADFLGKILYQLIEAVSLTLLLTPWLHQYGCPAHLPRRARLVADIALTSHQGEPGSIPGRFTPMFLHMGIVPDGLSAGFLGDLPFPPALSFRRCCTLISLRSHRFSRPRRYEPPKSLHSLKVKGREFVVKSRGIRHWSDYHTTAAPRKDQRNIPSTLTDLQNSLLIELALRNAISEFDWNCSSPALSTHNLSQGVVAKKGSSRAYQAVPQGKYISLDSRLRGEFHQHRLHLNIYTSRMREWVENQADGSWRLDFYPIGFVCDGSCVRTDGTDVILQLLFSSIFSNWMEMRLFHLVSERSNYNCSSLNVDYDLRVTSIPPSATVFVCEVCSQTALQSPAQMLATERRKNAPSDSKVLVRHHHGLKMKWTAHSSFTLVLSEKQFNVGIWRLVERSQRDRSTSTLAYDRHALLTSRKMIGCSALSHPRCVLRAGLQISPKTRALLAYLTLRGAFAERKQMNANWRFWYAKQTPNLGQVDRRDEGKRSSSEIDNLKHVTRDSPGLAPGHTAAGPLVVLSAVKLSSPVLVAQSTLLRLPRVCVDVTHCDWPSIIGFIGCSVLSLLAILLFHVTSDTSSVYNDVYYWLVVGPIGRQVHFAPIKFPLQSKKICSETCPFESV